MSDLLSAQVDLYPQLLRRMAAGERLGSESDDTEKLAASLLVAEAIERDQAEPAPAIEKKAIGLEVGLGSMALGAAIGGPLKRAIQKLRGVAALPEGEAELVKSFRTIIEERAKTDAAKNKLMLGIGGGALAGAAAIKLLNNKNESKAASEPVVAKKEAVAVSNIENKIASEKSSEQKAPEQKTARAVLGRLLKCFE